MRHPPGTTSIEHRIRDGLSRLSTAMRSDDWARAKVAAVNPTQYAILDYLYGRASDVSIKDLAPHLRISQPTVTDSVAALARKGLVGKHISSTDGRVVIIRLTQKGRDAWAAGEAVHGVAETATQALSVREQEDLLSMLVTMIRHLQETGAMPIQRMCMSCRYFRPYAHRDAEKPHHCAFVDAAFGQKDLRIDCREHETADPQFRAATWNAFRNGSVKPLQANRSKKENVR